MNEPLVLYHADMDGFAAAAVVAQDESGRGEYRAVQYGDPCPVEDAAGREVYVVDFAWPLEDMRRLRTAAHWLGWVDHHKTSAEDARTFVADGLDGMTCHDETCSGATLTWYALHGFHDEPPLVLRYVQDRDLWTWALPDSREINSALGLFWPLDQHSPARSYERFLATDIDALAPVGRALVASQRARVERLAKRAEPVTLDGLRALAVNATGDMSEIGHYLVETAGAEIGVVYFREGPGRWVHSLRSVGDLDVSAIAKARGGGGHRNAAGFQATRPCIEGGES